MPPQTTKTNLLARAAGASLAQSFLKHKDDEVQYDASGELPPGIENGLAELREIKIDEYKTGDNKGKLFFYAAGIVLSPREIDGVVIEGRRTSITESLCDTPNRQGKRKTFDDHFAWVANEIKKLGFNIADIKGTNGQAPTPEQIEAGLHAGFKVLKMRKPTFSFRTWKGQATPQFPNPRTQHTWNGLREAAVSVNGDGNEAAPPPIAEDATDGEVGEATTFAETNDLTGLAAKADAGDAAAKKELTDFATAKGISRKAVSEANSWAEVAAMIDGTHAGEVTDEEPAPEEEKEEGEETEDVEEEAAEAEDEVEEEPEAAGWRPTKGSMVRYRPLILDAKTKKTGRVKKARDCEILEVSKDGTKLVLKDMIVGATVVDLKTKKPLWVPVEEVEHD